jgi:hypothetical protein
MDIGIQQMKIIINTSIPSMDPIILSPEMLMYTGKQMAKLNKYPFFSMHSKYPRRLLQNLKYNKIVEFFFIKNNFENMLAKKNQTRKNMEEESEPPEDKNQENIYDLDSITNLKKENFILMLELLFPTTFYVVNNISTSLSKLIPSEKTNVSSFLSLKGTDLSFFPIMPKKYKKKFSYLKLQNKVYTISKTVWINDVMNHPVYSTILNSYYEFENWKTRNENDKILQKEKEKILYFLIGYIFNEKQKYNPIENSELDLLQVIDTGNSQNSNSNPQNIIRSSNEYDDYVKKFNNTIVTFIQKKKKIQIYIEEIVISVKQQFMDINSKEFKIKVRKILNEKLSDEKIKKDENEINILLQKLIDDLIDMLDYYKYINRAFNTKARIVLDNINFKIRDYNEQVKILEYINHLNFSYLNDEKSPNINNTISIKYPEFNNFVKNIKNISNRKIDNEIWRNNITSLREGDSGFGEMANTIKKCYNLDSIYGGSKSKRIRMMDPEKNTRQTQTRKNKKRKQTGGGRCNMNELIVLFDSIKDEKQKENDLSKPIVEVYLQMEVIEGKIDLSNMGDIKCKYLDEYSGNMYENLTQNNIPEWSVSYSNTFFDATPYLKKLDGKKLDGNNPDENKKEITNKNDIKQEKNKE